MATELEILCDYIRSETGYEEELTPNVDLLKSQILDSFSIVKLALFIQERFKIELEAEDVVRENLDNLSSIVALIERKRGASWQ